MGKGERVRRGFGDEGWREREGGERGSVGKKEIHRGMLENVRKRNGL